MALTMVGGFVGSAIADEMVNRGVSYVLHRRHEMASMDDTYARLKLAHSQLEFSLERSCKLPITDLSLLRQRRIIKRAFQECDMLLRSKQEQPPVHALVCDDHQQQAQQGVVTAAAQVAATATEAAAAVAAAAAEVAGEVAEFFSSSFLPVVSIACDAARSVSSSLGITPTAEPSPSIADVKRFEQFAVFADKFISNVESGSSLRHYRFFSPLIRQLLQGNTLEYEMVRATRTQQLWVCPVRSEDHGVVALLTFHSFDAKVPTKCFDIAMLLRLSENTNIVGISIQCLESLGPQFKSSAQVAIGELSQLPTQDLSNSGLWEIENRAVTSCLQHCRPNPACCEANVSQRACADNVIPPSQLESYRFPEQLLAMQFKCKVSSFGKQSSADQVNGWPLSRVKATFFPHSLPESEELGAWQTIGEQREDINGTSIEQMGEMVLANAITCFIRQPELTTYQMDWKQHHGCSSFTVEKGKHKVLPEPTPGSRRKTPRRGPKGTTPLRTLVRIKSRYI